jgi:hypothetical protein
MSVFTNPAKSAAGQAQAYITAVLALVGDKNPMDVLRATPGSLRRAFEAMPASQTRTPEAPGRWSAAQVIQHLADAELVWGYRVRMVLSNDRPSLTGYDQDLWAEKFRYSEADAQEAVEQFAVVRRSNLRLLEQASDADLRRVGVHVERGEESVAHLIRLNAGHDLLHLQQLERIRNATA